ncbi:terminase small subunit [Paenibacillus sp. CAU 1782]
MREQHKAFADYYIETQNATEAAKKAGYSEKTAYSIGSRLLKKVEIDAYIKERMLSKEADRVANQDEILEFLTSVMRGEVQDQMGFETSVRDRKDAAVQLGKRYGMWEDRIKHSGDVGVKIINDIPRR